MRVTNPQVPCPHELTEVSGLRRTDARGTAMCSGALDGAGGRECNPSLGPIDAGGSARLEWGTHELGGANQTWQRYVLRTDAQVTQMMDCRSPDASQCFNMPAGATWAEGREAAFNVDADGSYIARPGMRGCANLPGDGWSDMMAGPLPYVSGSCPFAFDPGQAEGEKACRRYRNTATCDNMVYDNRTCYPGAGSPKLASFNASNPRCWTAEPHKYCPAPTPAGKRDLFGDCTSDRGSCCAGLTCVAESESYAQCCVGPNDPVGCGVDDKAGDALSGAADRVAHDVTHEPPVVPQRRALATPPPAATPLAEGQPACGVHTVRAGAGYRKNSLGQTAPAAVDTCVMEVGEGYNSPACNQPPTPSQVCEGPNLKMKLVKYPEYHQSQYECRPTQED